MRVLFAAPFLRALKQAEPRLQKEVIEAVELFRDSKNHQRLRAHKLHGKLKGRYSFSVNYRIRILFEYEGEDTVILLIIGDHSVYE